MLPGIDLLMFKTLFSMYEKVAKNTWDHFTSFIYYVNPLLTASSQRSTCDCSYQWTLVYFPQSKPAVQIATKPSNNVMTACYGSQSREQGLRMYSQGVPTEECVTIHLGLIQEVDLVAKGVAEIPSEKLCKGKTTPPNGKKCRNTQSDICLKWPKRVLFHSYIKVPSKPFYK